MPEVVAWRPQVPGRPEVLHAHVTDHVHPSHTHESRTLLLIDAGAVRYHLDRHAHGATRGPPPAATGCRRTATSPAGGSTPAAYVRSAA